VLLADGSGGFQPVVTYRSGGVSPAAVAVADFNGDGKRDIALANSGSNAVVAFLNDGAGGFTRQLSSLSGGTSPRSLAAEDFNGDGLQDLAVANSGSGTVGVLLGNGTGTFAPATTYPSGGSGPTSLAAGDFNNDGRKDLAVTNPAGRTIAVLLGNGAGGFARPVVYDSGGAQPYAVTAADISGDGHADLAAVNYASNNLGVLTATSAPQPALVTLTSPGGFGFSIQTDGFGAGQLAGGAAGAFKGLNRLQVAGADYSPAIQANVVANGDRTVITPTVNLAGLYVHREITVPNTGAQDFVRTIEVLQNPSNSPITATVRLVGNLGSDPATAVFATADGNSTAEPGDLWVATDDADGAGAPAVVHYVRGPLGLKPTSVACTAGNLVWTYTVTVGAGQTVRLAEFTVVAQHRADALAAANILVTPSAFGGEATAFLTPAEVGSLANFQFDTAPLTVPSSVWGDAGLTLQRTGDGILHLYHTGGTQDAVPADALTAATSLHITGRNDTADTLTLDFLNGTPLPPGGITYNGGSGGAGNSLAVADGAHANAWWMSSAQLTVDGTPVRYSNVQNFQFDLGTGTMDLGGAAVSVSSVTLVNGTISYGTLTSGAITCQSGTVSAGLAGPGALVKTGSGNLTLAGANTYTGGTTISAGTLVVTNGNAVPPGYSLAIHASATLVLPQGATGQAPAAIRTASVAVGQASPLVQTVLPELQQQASETLTLPGSDQQDLRVAGAERSGAPAVRWGTATLSPSHPSLSPDSHPPTEAVPIAPRPANANRAQAVARALKARDVVMQANSVAPSWLALAGLLDRPRQRLTPAATSLAQAVDAVLAASGN
jgi:autotransporter-associated beta strand protein